MNGQRPSFLKSEDWWAVILGCFIFVLGLGASFKADLLGWAVCPDMWVDVAKSIKPVSAGFGSLCAVHALLLTYLFLTCVTGFGAWIMGANVGRYALGFTIIFVLTYLCVIVGNHAFIAANKPTELVKYNLSWSLRLTDEAGLILALAVGLIIGNFIPALSRLVNVATKPEWFIKTAIVLLGAEIGVKAAGQLQLAKTIIVLGLCSIIVAYLIYWAMVYYIARRFFGFSREWAAPLASGISICGVSAAIATGGAIRARPVVPIMVSSLVVVFAVIELIILPFAAQGFLYKEPMVAAAWMGLAVKTDGGAIASGAITEGLIYSKALKAQGVEYEKEFMQMATTTIKVFIDVFIGVWAFILAIIWCKYIDHKPGEQVRAREIWDRFPKFVLGYIGLFLLLLFVCLLAPSFVAKAKLMTAETSVFRKLFFALTFLAIGLVSDFKRLWQEGIGRLMAVYVLCLFGFIIWIALGVSWLFFHGIMPPTIR